MYKYIIFDLDGTITDSKEGIVKSLKYSFDQVGCSNMNESTLESYIGLSLENIYADALKTDDIVLINSAISYYRERFAEEGMFQNKLYNGIDTMLNSIAEGRQIMLASIKPALYSNPILEYFNIRHYFDFIIGSSIDGRHSDKAELIDIVLRSRSYPDKKECIMIGDRAGDINGAHINGIDSIAVTYGYSSMKELKQAKPDYFAQSPGDITDIIHSSD